MKANAPLWIVSLGQGGGDAAAVGGPGAPIITNPEGGSVIAFTAGEVGAAGPTLGYGASIEPEGPMVDVQVTNPSAGGEVVLSQTEPNTDYVVTIYGVNVAGRGKAANTEPFQLNYNVAEGGDTIVDEDDYNDTGQKWRIHTFNNSGTFTVKSTINNFRYVVAAGGGGAGGGSGNNAQGWTAGGGGSGGVLNNDDLVLPLGDIPITVGNGGNGAGPSGSGASPRGAAGGASKIGEFVVTVGGGGGNHSGGSGGSGGGGGFANSNGGGGGGTLGQGTSGTGGNGQSQPAGNGGGAGDGTSTAHTGNGRVDNITGTNVTYGNRYGTIGGGGPGNTRYELTGASGKKGQVVIAYQIGMSSQREIKQAQIVRAARLAAYADGHSVGMTDGRDERDSEIAYVADLQVAAAAEAEPKPKRTRKKAD